MEAAQKEVCDAKADVSIIENKLAPVIISEREREERAVQHKKKKRRLQNDSLVSRFAFPFSANPKSFFKKSQPSSSSSSMSRECAMGNAIAVPVLRRLVVASMVSLIT